MMFDYHNIVPRIFAEQPDNIYNYIILIFVKLNKGT